MSLSIFDQFRGTKIKACYYAIVYHGILVDTSRQANAVCMKLADGTEMWFSAQLVTLDN